MTQQAVLSVAQKCFPQSGVRAWMQRNRPHICPFYRLISHVPRGSRVLDVGCGDGLFLALLCELGTGITGVGFDSSQRAIASARAMRIRTGCEDRIQFLHVDARGDWPAGEFDVVSMIDVLHHVPPGVQRHVLELAASRVQAGGLLIYKDIAAGPRGWMNRLHDMVVAREWIHYAPVAQVEHWATSCGLTIAAREETRLLWYPHQLRVFRRP